MLVSPSRNGFDKVSNEIPPIPNRIASARVRIRTLHVCEPSYPPREMVRRENYARRQAQKNQGWTCPPGVPYQGIDPVHLPPQPIKEFQSELIHTAVGKPPPRPSISASSNKRPKSSASGQTEESVAKMQYENTMKRLQTAEQRLLKKSSDILKGVQLGRSVKDIIEQLPRSANSRGETIETRGAASIVSDEKDSDVAYGRILDDSDEDDSESASVSDIRDDIMSPRTITNTCITSAHHVELFDSARNVPDEMSLVSTKYCQSAPPLNRCNTRQSNLRPFTPRFNSLSSKSRITRGTLCRDALYRQLCCILWLLRAMNRSDWNESVGGCWNIDQWLRNESRSHVNHHSHQNQQLTKKQHDPIKDHRQIKGLTTEKKSTTNDQSQKENAFTSLRKANANFNSGKKSNITVESNSSRTGEPNIDDTNVRRSTFSDASERFDLQMVSTMINENDLAESISSKSNNGDVTDSSTADGSHMTGNFRSAAATPAVYTTNTSRTSISTQPGQMTSRALTGRLTAIMERRRSPDVLMKKWMRNQKLTNNPSKEPVVLSELQVRLLRVGDNEDLKRIFGLENSTDVNKDQIRERQTRSIERKLVTNVKRRPMTSVDSGESLRHAQAISKIKREFNDFTEEQSIILNNRLEQVDNERLFYCQNKLRELQQNMPPLTILDRLLKHLRANQGKKKTDAAYLKFQPWYPDLLQLVQPVYENDAVIVLLLKELEDLADPSEKPTVIRFKIVLSGLKPHEICHPDIMAAIEFVRIHILKMSMEDFDKFFVKQFPTVTKYLTTQNDLDEKEDNKQETKSVI